MTHGAFIIRSAAAAVAALAVATRLAAAQEKPPAPKLPCPPIPADSARERYGRVFIDGRLAGGNLRLRREGGEPESYEIVDPEPRELEQLPVSKIDLIQYDSGPEAEAKYSLCKGMVAIVIKTKG